jgi:uncharacterized damage-inducible protein DinB
MAPKLSKSFDMSHLKRIFIDQPNPSPFMKKTFGFIFTIICLSAIVVVPGQSFAQTTMEEFVAKWDNSKQFTLEVVDKMPDNLLDYKPDPGAMSFKEQVTHLSAVIVMISSNFLKGGDPGFAADAKPATKAELRAFVEKCYDYGKKSVAGLSDADRAEKVEIFGSQATRRQVIALMDDHTTHHRGAAVSYIRANGIEPPAYRGW